MHEMMLNSVIERCLNRQQQGDCPSDPPFSVEQLEDAVVILAGRQGKEVLPHDCLQEKEILDIAEQAAEIWFIGEDALGKKRVDQSALIAIIASAIHQGLAGVVHPDTEEKTDLETKP